MNTAKNMSGEAGEQGNYIWLRYATQFTVAGKQHTVEIGIPMPIGATMEEREALLREANAGMDQLSSHVQNRVAQMLQRAQPTQGSIPAPAPPVKPAVALQPQPVTKPPTSSAPPAQPASPIASQSLPPTPASPLAQTREEQPARNSEMTASLARPSIGMSMPSTGDITGNPSLPQFIRYIKDNLDLNPTQAMELLKVKSLTGINLREALDQLQRIVGSRTDATDASKKAVSTARTGSTTAKNTGSTAATTTTTNTSIPTPTTSVSLTSGRVPTPTAQDSSSPRGVSSPADTHNVKEERPSYGFDEELDLDDGLPDDLELDDLDQPHQLTPQERIRARDLLSRFRESQGAALASPARLKVLSNVTDGQVSEDQLVDLVSGIWNIPSLKRLKVDQVEALISWAKEDEFVNDADIVLAFLEEE